MNNEEKTIMELDLDTTIKIVIYSTKNKNYKTILLNHPYENTYRILYENGNPNICICGNCGCEIKSTEDYNKHYECEEEYFTYKETKNFINEIFNDSEIDDRTIIEIQYPDNTNIKITKRL